MEYLGQPPESTDVGLQTDDEIQETAVLDLGEDVASSVPSLRDEAAFQEQDPNFNAQSKGVQSIDEQPHTEESQNGQEDLPTSEDIVSPGDEPPDSDMSAEKQYKQEAQSTPLDDVIDQALTTQQHIGDQTASELIADLPGAEQVPETMHEDHIQILNDTMTDEITVSQREEEEPSTEKDVSSDITSPTATGSLFEWSLTASL